MTPPTAIETVNGSVFQVKQAALGTIEPPTTTTTKRLRHVGDDVLKPAKTTATEEYVDGKSWGNPTPYVDAIGGDVGSFACQGQIETTGFIFAQIIGVDVVTGTTPDFIHTQVTGTAHGPLQTVRQEVGLSVGPFKNSFWDARVKTLTLNCGQDQKVLRLVQAFLCLHAANWYTTSPTVTDSGTDSFNWAEAVGTHSIGGTVFTEIDGEALELETNLDVFRGDNPSPVCFIFGKGTITRTKSGIVTDGTIPVIQNALYGTTTMTDGLAPNNAVNTVAMASTYTRTAARSLALTNPKVEVDPSDFMIGPKAEGGTREITFGGRCYESAGTELTVVAKTGDAAAYV